jgi:hypothetical protein
MGDDVWAGAEELPHTDIGKAVTARPLAYNGGMITAVGMRMYCPRGKHEAEFIITSGRFSCQTCHAVYQV